MDHVSVDGYVIDSLMPDLVGHDRMPSAFLVYLYLWRRTRGGARAAVVSYAMMTDGTGLSQRSVQTAVRALEPFRSRRLLRARLLLRALATPMERPPLTEVARTWMEEAPMQVARAWTEVAPAWTEAARAWTEAARARTEVTEVGLPPRQFSAA
jgi:hypothetical protein